MYDTGDGAFIYAHTLIAINDGSCECTKDELDASFDLEIVKEGTELANSWNKLETH